MVAAMPTLETASGPLSYDEHGNGSGDPIVLLSSGAHNRHDFDGLRAALPSRFRTIAPDWPGHGESPPGRGPATAMRLADVAEELVAQLAPDGAIVVGNSVGGFAAGRLAVRSPELVRGLVLVDSGGFLGRPPQVRAFCALMARPRFLRAIYPRFAERYMRPRNEAERRVRDVGIATTRRDPGLRAVSELWRSFASPEHDLRAEAGSIAAPTLVVWGKHDPVIPLKVGRKIAATIPSARLEVFDSGHAPHVSDPEGFAAQLTTFADSVLAKQPGAEPRT
jgi:pimeloyl-ACP methyl ester carboxylesterase